MGNFENNLRLVFSFHIWKDFVDSWQEAEKGFACSSLNKFADSFVLSQTGRNYTKPTSYEILEKFKSDPDIYVSYIKAIPDMEKGVGNKKPRMKPRVGINPKSHYNTPLGIYTYPLQKIWNEIESNESLSSVPYGGQNPYIAILKVKRDAKFVNDMHTDYDDVDEEEDTKKLKQFFVPNVLTEDLFNQIEATAYKKAKENHSAVVMWNLVRYLSYIMVEAKRIAKENSKENSVEFPSDSLIESLVKRAISFNDLSGAMPDKEPGKLNSYGLMFNRILNGVLGYDGFADKSGKGYIHESEPTQAVFLDPRAYDIVGIIENEHSPGSGRERAVSKNRGKIRNMINSSGESLSDNAWRNILMGYPEFWGECPDDRSAKWDSRVIVIADNFYYKNVYKVNAVQLGLLKLPKGFENLPKTKKSYVDKWEQAININPLVNVFAPSALQAENPDLVNKSKKAWKKHFLGTETGIENWLNCTFEDVRNDPEVLNHFKEYWTDRLKAKPKRIEKCPLFDRFGGEMLALEKFDENYDKYKEIHDSLLDAAVEGTTMGLRENPNLHTITWQDLPPELQDDPRVLDELKDAWIKLLVTHDAALNQIPSLLLDRDNNGEFYNMVKEKWMKSIDDSKKPFLTNNVQNVQREYNLMPSIIKHDKDVVQKIADVLLELIDSEDIDLISETVSEELLTIEKVAKKAISRWKDFLKEYPGRIDSLPFVYRDRVLGDPDLWKSMLEKTNFNGRLFTLCEVPEIRNNPEVKQKVANWWEYNLGSGVSFSEFPDEFKFLGEKPEIMKKIVAKNPNALYGFDIPMGLNDAQRTAYWEGLKTFAYNSPFAWDLFSPGQIETLKKDPKIDKKWKQSFIQKALPRVETKLKNPYGDDLYKEPELEDALKGYLKRHFYASGTDAKTILANLLDLDDFPRPDLAKEIAENPDFKNRKRKYLRDEAAKQPPEYAKMILEDEGVRSDPVAYREILKHFADVWEAKIVRDGAPYCNVPSVIMEEIQKDDKMRKMIFQQWVDYIKLNFISTDELYASTSSSYGPPNFVEFSPEFIDILESIQWFKTVRTSPERVGDVPDQIKVHPYFLELVGKDPKVQQTMGGKVQQNVENPNIVQNNEDTNKDMKQNVENPNIVQNNEDVDDIKYETTAGNISSRTIWASSFNDNIILSF